MPSRRFVLRSMAVVGGGLACASPVVPAAVGVFAGYWESYLGHFALFAAFFAIFVWLAAARQPDNRVVWIMAACSLLAGWYSGGAAAASAIHPELDLSMSPSELPTAVAWLVFVVSPAGVPAFLLLLTLGVLLFPDGRLPSPRWRWVAIAALVAITAATAAVMWTSRPSSPVPLAEDGPHVEWLFPLIVAIGAVCVASLVVRYRRSSGAVRRQIKWIGWGAAVNVMTFGLSEPLTGERESLALVIVAAGVLVLVASYGIAITRHGLFDIDVVISRTLVYGALATFIGTIYVTVVVGVGSAVGRGEEPDAALAIVATAIVAVGFQPLRRRLQRFANRLVYGRRFTPYEVLADFSNRVGSADEALLVEAARSLVDGTGAESAAIWVGSGPTPTRRAVWPPDADEHEPSLDDSGRRHRFPVEHGGRQLGTVTLTAPRGQSLDDGDRRLAAELAAALGLTLGNEELTETLRARVKELQESRLRLVAVQDETRRRLERDLHDGAQQQLVAMKVRLSLAAKVAERDGATSAAAGLASLIDAVDRAVDEMRDFARGVYPPLLESEGLGAALNAMVAKSPLPVSLQIIGVDRYPRRVEATVYFCVVEALRNVATHAAARSAHVAVIDREGFLTIEVTDDGVGFDGHASTSGTGLANMEDRFAAAGGTLRVESAPGAGTTVVGRLPVAEERLVHA